MAEKKARSGAGGNERAAGEAAGKVQKVKCTLDVYPLPHPEPMIDRHFLGKYGYRVLLKTGAFDIPVGFLPRLVVRSIEGNTSNGAVTGRVSLRYGGTPENWNEEWAFWEDLEITGFSVSGAQPGVIPLAALIAVADSQLDVRLRSKDAV